LIAILLLAVLSTVSSGESLAAADLAATLGRLAAFLALTIGGGLLIVPPLVRAIVRLERPETTVVSSVGLSFAFALIAYGAGYSVALGAFLGGAIVAESGEASTVEHLVQPIRDMFAAIFFVAVGMLIDPALVAEYWVAIVVLTIVVVAGKLLGVFAGVFLAGEGIRTSVQAGMSLAQIGEFSFIIAAAGLAAGATGPFLYPIAVAVSAITTLLTPWLIRSSDAMAGYVDDRLPAPVQTFAALYRTWVESIRATPREPSVGRRVRRLSRLLVVDAFALAGIVIATAVWGSQMAERVRASQAIPPDFTWGAVIAAATGLAAPFCFGIARCTAALAGILSGTALPRVESKADFADAPRRALIVTLQLAILLVVGIPLVALTQPFLPPLPGAVVLAVIIVLLGIGINHSAANLHAHARAGAQAIVEAFARRLARDAPAGNEQRELDTLHKLLPGLGTPVPLRIPAGSPTVGKTLAELRLRALTGATVLAIVREGKGVITPTGTDALRAGDVLAVAGTAEAIQSALDLLGSAPAPEAR
jgi:CPA2 family monovalent cation:H+ antiporter-2